MQTRIERVATANPAAFTGERRTNAVTGQRKAERDQRYLLAIGSAPAATGWVSPPGVENSWSIKLPSDCRKLASSQPSRTAALTIATR